MNSHSGLDSLSDPELSKVLEAVRAIPNVLEKTAECLREAIDHTLVGQKTGRFSIADLTKQEKAHIGTQVEIWLRRELFHNLEGESLDTVIAGIEVDIKNTIGSNWMIPTEATGKLCLLSRIDEKARRFSLGLIRTNAEILTKPNKDAKRGISAIGLKNVHWIADELELPVSIFLKIDSRVRDAIFRKPTGQQRVREMFRLVQRVPIRWEDIATAARQRDVRARARDASDALRTEGICVLSHRKAAEFSEKLLNSGIEVPPDHWVSVPSSILE